MDRFRVLKPKSKGNHGLAQIFDIWLASISSVFVFLIASIRIMGIRCGGFKLIRALSVITVPSVIGVLV